MQEKKLAIAEQKKVTSSICKVILTNWHVRWRKFALSLVTEPCQNAKIFFDSIVIFVLKKTKECLCPTRWNSLSSNCDCDINKDLQMTGLLFQRNSLTLSVLETIIPALNQSTIVRIDIQHLNKQYQEENLCKTVKS